MNEAIAQIILIEWLSSTTRVSHKHSAMGIFSFTTTYFNVFLFLAALNKILPKYIWRIECIAFPWVQKYFHSLNFVPKTHKANYTIHTFVSLTCKSNNVIIARKLVTMQILLYLHNMFVRLVKFVVFILLSSYFSFSSSFS